MKKTFKKDEKLRSRSIIDRLFQRGNSEVQTFYIFPFRVLYVKEEGGRIGLTKQEGRGETAPTPLRPHVQVLFSVSKRNFKRAVDRNLIRRRCREAYRLHKHLLAENTEFSSVTSVAFLYLAKEISPYDVIEKSMVKISQKMVTPPSS